MSRTPAAVALGSTLLLLVAGSALAGQELRPEIAPAQTPGGAGIPVLSFDQLDLNGDGELTPDEVKGTAIERRFPAMDAGRDGRLSKREYLAAMGVTAEDGPGAFDLLDVNGNGAVSREEASVDPRLAGQFREADADHDGGLDRSEFSAFQAVQGAEDGAAF